MLTTKGHVDHDVNFTILQINDVYKIEGLEGGDVGGIARVRTLRKQLEAEGREVLVLHAGDLLFPSVMSKYLRAQPMIKVLNLLDGDPAAFDKDLVVVFGNHEFDDKDPGLLLGRVAQSDFAWVSSNVRYRSVKDSYGAPFSQRLNNVHDVIVLDVGGVRVGIFGLTVDAQRRDYVTYDYGDIAARKASIQSALGRLKRENAQVIIALTHQDLDQDELMAKDFPEIDIVIGGHEHFYIQRKVGNTLITKADSDAQSAIVYNVRVPADGPVTAEHRKVEIGPGIEHDPVVDAEVQHWISELSKAVKKQKGYDLLTELGTTKYLLEGVEPAVRGRETALGNFLADAVRNRMNTDLAFINGGGIRINDDIPPGPITNYDMEGIFYFNNNLVSFELTGAELLDILRNSVSKAHLGDGRFLQVSGIKFNYHVGGTKDNPIYTINPGDVKIKPQGDVDFIPLELNRKYTTGTIDYIWEYGYRDGYKIFSQGNNGSSPEIVQKGIDFRSTVEDVIAKLRNRMVTTQVEGRIIKIQEP
ncbi:5'-nucleotidase/2',3'-cyclic phosphodiesterase and related esterase [Candidatus Scalindua japonica]|uniref:5'-nucleotidase/2',3'-cyclic phosphodiesterase and related esterase n=2 Tax=Candidatus Scalindua japonica TaxID=1284222 RepID=A0A286TTY2_9BACT|nr:5'-nucleotidase/2',3'-cyclic phosphodiesterase and related esterase [Candidatus Scalindua japonica]